MFLLTAPGNLSESIGNGMPVASKKSKLTKEKGTRSALEFWAMVAVVTTFAPEPYELRRPLLIVLQRNGEGIIASFSDANIHASGDTEEEAFQNLKSLILDVFDSLLAESPANLGPEPKRQLAVLKEFISKKR